MKNSIGIEKDEDVSENEENGSEDKSVKAKIPNSSSHVNENDEKTETVPETEEKNLSKNGLNYSGYMDGARRTNQEDEESILVEEKEDNKKMDIDHSSMNQDEILGENLKWSKNVKEEIKNIKRRFLFEGFISLHLIHKFTFLGPCKNPFCVS